MIYGIFSDVHSNLTALETVLLSMDSRGVEQRVSLGDVVGYGPDVNQCVSLVQREATVSLMGNHDSAAIGAESLRWFNSMAGEALRWTSGQLTAESRAYLASQLLVHSTGTCTCVHGTPVDPHLWNYLESSADAAKSAAVIDTALCAVGHTHRSVVYSVPTDEWPSRVEIPVSPLVLDLGALCRGGTKAVFCVGAVGQPRDYDNRACWCLLDTDRMTLEYVRVPYDVASVQARIVAAGLPACLAERLGNGS